MKKILSLFILVIMLSFLVFPKKVEATVSGTKWQSVPVTVYATNQLNYSERLLLQSAISEWNSIGCGTLLIYGGVKSNISTPGADSFSTVGRAYLPSGDVANTTRLVNASNPSIIIEADITLNTSTTMSSFNLKSVFMHELGHLLGLSDNTYSITSIMYNAYTGNTTISSYDINDINTIY